jgi:hypothetical protein
MESETDMRNHGPPARRGFIERTLRHLAGGDVAEAAWGDLEEEVGALSRRYGRAAARLWISLQGLHLILGLVDRNVFSPERWFGEVIMDSWTDRRRRLVAFVGVLAALPAALLVASGVLYSLSAGGATAQALDATLYDPEGFVFRVVLHPAVILGGLTAAVALNLIPLLRLRFETRAGTVSATIGLRLRLRHLVIAAAGLGLLAMILAYAFTENFELVSRTQARRAASAVAASVAAGADRSTVRAGDRAWIGRGAAGDA